MYNVTIFKCVWNMYFFFAQVECYVWKSGSKYISNIELSQLPALNTFLTPTFKDCMQGYALSSKWQYILVTMTDDKHEFNWETGEIQGKS